MAEVTFNFKNEGLQQNLADFVTGEPIPTDVDGTDLYTPAEWARQYAIRNWKQAIQKGKNMRLKQEIEEDIIT
jgi:hypothetical protein